jgi:hypothetical protein
MSSLQKENKREQALIRRVTLKLISEKLNRTSPDSRYTARAIMAGGY